MISPSARRRLLWAAQVAVFAFVLWRIGTTVGAQWTTVSARVAHLSVRWPLAALSVVPIAAAYAVLIESWRRLIRASGSTLRFAPAARIYLVSKLGVYVPGRVWQIAALGMLSRREGVAPVAATGAAVIGTVANIAAGFAVLLVGGARVIHAVAPRAGRTPLVVAGAVTAALLALPFALPEIVRFAARLTGKSVAAATPGVLTLAGVVAANVAAWACYGIGFTLFARAILPSAGGEWLDGLTVFTGSYLAGYLAIVVPGGVGVREAAMAEALTALHLATPADAWLLAFASRLWLTVIEVLPGLAYLARAAAVRPTPSRIDGPPS